MKYTVPFTILMLVASIKPSYAGNVPSELAALAISPAEMEANRGTSGINPAMLTSAQLSAYNGGNTINNPQSGNNYIADNSFQNSSGIINVIQNSGNGVVIQNSTVVNLTLQ
jgi:hypothetical protein